MTAIIIQVAMDEEAQPFLDAARQVSDPLTVGRAVHRGIVLGDATVVLVVSGIGMVNAADAAVGAVHRYGPDGVILVSAGSAGGLAADARVGDVVVGTSVVNVDADARAFGYALGQVPGMPAVYETDAQLATALAASDRAVHRAAMGSGEKFVTADLAHALRTDFSALWSIDMETAAIAQAAHESRCALRRVPRDQRPLRARLRRVRHPRRRCGRALGARRDRRPRAPRGMTDPAGRRIRLDIAYDGFDFKGWAAQPGLRTVQGTIEEALWRVLRSDVRLVVAGRTDAGVHATGQVAHADLDADQWERATRLARGRQDDGDPVAPLARKLRGVLRPYADVTVARTRTAPEGFERALLRGLAALRLPRRRPVDGVQPAHPTQYDLRARGPRRRANE